MSVDPDRIGLERNIKVPAAEIYRIITLPKGMQEWLCDEAYVDAHPGGNLFLKWHSGYAVMGEFISLEKNLRARFSWKGKADAVDSLVEISLVEHHDGTLVHLVHRAATPDPDWPTKSMEFREHWKKALDNLQSILETGIDQRLAKRPVIGIVMDSLNDAAAARIGAPVSGGILLSGITDGTGAQAVGLQADDILTGFDGKPLTSYQDLFIELENRQVGDTIQLTYYRGKDQFTAQVTLTQRQMPSHLLTTTELADMIGRQFDLIDQELAGSIGDTSENQLSSRPGSPEWTIKTSLAQIIAVERDLHTWISDLLTDHAGIESPSFSSVSNERLTAILDVYPTILALMEEFLRCQAETVALLSYLPDELVQRKYIYFRIIDIVSDTLDHFREHMKKIRKITVRE